MRIFGIILAVVAALIGVIYVSVHHGPQAASTTAPAPTGREFGPPVTVCVYSLYTGERLEHATKSGGKIGEIKCGTLRTGMTAEEVTAEIGDHLHGDGMIERRTTGEGTQETWRFFGPTDHNNHVVTGFDNGFLRVVVQ